MSQLGKLSQSKWSHLCQTLTKKKRKEGKKQANWEARNTYAHVPDNRNHHNRLRQNHSLAQRPPQPCTENTSARTSAQFCLLNPGRLPPLLLILVAKDDSFKITYVTLLLVYLKTLLPSAFLNVHSLPWVPTAALLLDQCINFWRIPLLFRLTQLFMDA